MIASLDVANLVVRPTIVLLLAAVVTLLLSRRSAASRHLVWSAALCGVLAIPLFAAVLPRLELPVGGTPAGPIVRTIDGWTGLDGVGAWGPTGGLDSASPAAPADTDRRPDRIPWAALWLAGTAASLTALALRYGALRRIERAASKADDTPLADCLEAARCRLGLNRHIRLLVGESDAMPMTWGLRIPRILLPADAREWPEAQTEVVLLHELAHVRRGDVALQRFAELARAVFWFNPLTWLAARRMLTEREHACDDAVLRAGVRGSEYAHQLLAMAHSLRTARGSACALPMARRSQMTGRLLAILDEGRTRWTPTGAAPPLALGLAALLALAVTAVSPVATGTVALRPTANEAAGAPATTPQLPAGHQATTTITPHMTGCWHPIGPDSNHNKNEDPGVITASWSTTRCIGSLRILGRAVLAADSSGFAALSPGGSVTISEKEGDIWRDLDLTGRYDGQIELDGRFGDRTATHDEVDGWLRANLRPMLRLTAVELEVAGRP